MPHHDGSAASVLFATAFYREHKADVAAAGMSPLVHSLQFGMTEHRGVFAIS